MSVRNYLGTLRLVLDFAERDPNPARDRRVKLPRLRETVPNPPTAAEVTMMIENAPRRWRLAIRALEQIGLRVGELAALEWGDVDRANLRLRVRNGKTSAARRWVSIPEWLRRSRRPVLRTTSPRPGESFPAPVRTWLATRCGTPAKSTASPTTRRTIFAIATSRSRSARVSRVTEIAAHVGHSRKSLTLDTYAHVLIDE